MSGQIRRVFSLFSTGLSDLGSFYADEKLAPFLSLFTVSGEDEGLTLSRRLLQAVGAGRTAIIHSTNAARVERFARAMPAGRILGEFTRGTKLLWNDDGTRMLPDAGLRNLRRQFDN